MNEKIFYIIFLLFLINNNCWADDQILKKQQNNQESLSLDKYMSKEQAERISSIPQADITDEHIILQNGENLHDYLNKHFPDSLINHDFDNIKEKK